MTTIKLLTLFFSFLVVYKVLILYLKRTKTYQQIYELSPESHSTKKHTPTFGGVGLVICVIIGLISIKAVDIRVIWCVGMYISFSLIGFIDDLVSIKKKLNKGFSAKHKFLYQCSVTIVGLSLYSYFIVELSPIEYLIYGFIIVGTSNATNLTDGLDGLLTGSSIIAFSGFLLLFSKLNDGSFQTFTIVIMCALTAFLFFNKFPAKIFLGDTGSLGIGALLASMAVVIRNPWVLLCLGGVFVIETVSVIIQVAYYKRTKKRVFLMAPLHHHFELCGFSEFRTVLLFWGVSLSFFGIFVSQYLK